jgi:HSP20 family molecular chaperone IbpA
MSVKTQEETTKTLTPSQKQEVPGAEPTHPGRVYTPLVDISETDGAIVLFAEMPGVTAENLSIDLRENLLTIDGRVQETQVVRPGERALLLEYEPGSFYRQFRLSNKIDQARIKASLTDGVLRLELPKAEAARPRTIQVHAG